MNPAVAVIAEPTVPDTDCDEGEIDALAGGGVKLTTSTGVLLFVVALFPNWPEAFSPQHFTPPDDITAHVCL